ncbi:MAG: hypothetical protein J5967_08010, partial [Oscillospiraceae bacterium]|nr:hypothetical protein [Oscillospiraceae bacterium]
MKKRWLAVVLALCLCASLVPVGARADDDPATQYKDAVGVSTYETMKNALPSEELEPNNENVVLIPVAELTQNLELTSEQDIRTQGKLIIPSGVTLTINSSFEAETEIQSGGAVVVKNGGYFCTTMGGDTQNAGTITVEKGGVMQSTMGASIVNQDGGTITLNGTFYCGSVNYENADHLWFANSGTVSGSGDVIVYEAGAGDEGRASVNLDTMIQAAKTALNNKTISVYKQVTVSSSDALESLFNAQRGVEGNADIIAELQNN